MLKYMWFKKKQILNYIVSFISKFANITLDLFILVCSIFYFVRDGDRCMEFIKSFSQAPTPNVEEALVKSKVISKYLILNICIGKRSYQRIKK